VPALLALAGVVLAVVLFLVLKDDTADDDSVTSTPSGQTTPADPSNDAGEKADKPKPEKPELPVVEVAAGKPVGGVQELEFKSGEEARFEVMADAVDELHFHGYDLYVDVVAGKTTDVSFKADIEGVFELESHTTGELLAEISVVP